VPGPRPYLQAERGKAARLSLNLAHVTETRPVHHTDRIWRL
jgi:hypothetical protein